MNIKKFFYPKSICIVGASSKEKSIGCEILNSIKTYSFTGKVFPVNPNAEIVEGDKCFPDLRSIPEKIDAVVISTRPEVVDKIVHDCAEIGIQRVWMHRSFGKGSISNTATQFCAENNISVIPGACPMMYCQPVDFGHKCMRWFLGLFGLLPK